MRSGERKKAFRGRGHVGLLPISVVVFLILFAIFYVVERRTVFGRSVHAIGGNLAASHLSAIPVARVRMATYAISGASAALAGVILVPLAILLSAGALYFRFSEVRLVQAVLTGMSAGAAGTAIAGAFKLAQPYPWTVKGAALALVTFVAVAGFQLPLAIVLAVMLPVSIALAWPRRA